jgi:transposase
MFLPHPHRRRRCTTMMGTKIRNFAPLADLSLEELVPKDNFYRRLDATLDLSFIRDLVRDCYASSGRPSVDPVVFFKTLSTRCPH